MCFMYWNKRAKEYYAIFRINLAGPDYRNETHKNNQCFEINRFVGIIDSYQFNTINWKKILVRDLFYNKMALQLSMIARYLMNL